MKALFFGDVSPTIDNYELFAAGDLDALFHDVQDLFPCADASMINLECALTEAETSIPKKGPALKAPLATAQTLARLGVTHCGLSNNHFFDFGIQGAMDSLAALEAAGIAVTGFGQNVEDSRRDLVIRHGNETVCVIAVCEHEYSYALDDRMGCRPFDEFDTPLDIRAAKEKWDRVVVMYHGGKEHCQYPSPRLRKACHTMAKSGADLILCQHSHCIGTYEQIAGCHILYGQGNFHFVKNIYRKYEGWFECLAVRYDSAANTVEFIPLVSSDERGMRLANEGEKKEILDAFAQRNRSFADGTWRDGWHAFCESMQTPYLRVVERALAPDCTPAEKEQFAHYLDCEAHTDVWRELFPTYNQFNEKA